MGKVYSIYYKNHIKIDKKIKINIKVIGPTNSGKTTFIKNFCKSGFNHSEIFYDKIFYDKKKSY